MTTLILILSIGGPHQITSIGGFPSSRSCEVEGARWAARLGSYFCVSIPPEPDMTFEEAPDLATKETDNYFCKEGKRMGDYWKIKYFCKPVGAR